MKQYHVFLDAECDGLYGSFISVAMVAADAQGRIVDEMYKGLKKELLDTVSNPWVRENVLPVMGDYDEVDSEADLLEAVWDFWMHYADNGYMVVDVGYPVEMRLLMQCVEKDMDSRAMKAPFPLLDLSSILYAKGMDPNIDRNQFSTDVLHNPLNDVKIAAAIWKKLMLGDE